MKYLKKFWPILVMIVLSAIYFKPEFDGKVILGSDSSQGLAKDRARQVYTEKTGDNYLWNPGIFSGMDVLHGATTNSNIYKYFMKAKHSLSSRGFGIFLICLLISYILAQIMGLTKLLSLIMAFAITFSLNNIVLYKVGHFSKIDTLIYSPLILAGIYVLFEKSKYLLGAFLLTIGIGLSIYTRHPQMNYYLVLLIFPYLIIKSISFIKEKQFVKLGKIVLAGIVALTLGLGSNIDRVWNLKVHSEASMRGKKILTTNESNVADTDKPITGLDWEYAMAWSNNTTDLVSTIIPGFSGGSSSEIITPDHPLAKKYGMKAAPLYWGGLPFTESPMYLGVIFVFLMILTLSNTKSIWVWGLFIGVLFTVLISLGKNLEGLQRILFDYFPLYNKFRAPSSILNVTGYIIPVLGSLILHAIYKKTESGMTTKKLWIVSGSFMTFILICMTILPDLTGLSNPADDRYVQQGLQLFDLLDARKEYINSDSLRAVLLIGLTSIAIHFYLKNKIKYNVMLLGIFGLIAFDMLTVNARYYRFDDYKSKVQAYRVPALRPADRQILSIEKNREDYRLLDLSINTYNNTASSYYHNTIGGYSPVKYQRYQDIIDRHILKGNMNVLNMLNTKYIINQQGQLQGNSQAHGTAWFVKNVEFASTPDQEIALLDSISTANTAIINENEFGNQLSELNIQNSEDGKIELVNYTPDEINYTSSSSSDQLAVFSEIWMDGKQWRLYIDGNESNLIRANYLLRSAVIPKGDRSIQLKFEPKSFYMGGTYTLLFGLVVLLFAGFIGYQYYKEKQGPINK